MNYRVIYEEKELYYTKSVIINGLLPFRFNKIYRIESLRTSNNHIVVYKDKTTKRIKCIIEQEDTEDGKEYIVMLGDVTALETKKL